MSRLLLTGALIAFCGASFAHGQSCYSWSRSFTGPDFDQPPTTSIVFDAGSGPRLFMAGQFTQAGGVSARSIARLDATGWSALGGGTGPNGGSVGVYAMVVFDEDGPGPGAPALYAGGIFETMSGTPSRCIAKWNGTAWQTVGNGMWGNVQSLAVHDDGTGEHLYAGGGIQLQNGGTVHGLVKLSDGAWVTLPEWSGGINVKALASHDDGHGSALFAAVFNGTVYRLAGGSCEGIGAGSFSPASTGCFKTFADSEGSRLYFGSGNAGVCLSAWDGTSWTRIQNPGTSFGGLGVRGLTVWDDGAGEALYVMGELQGTPDAAMSGIGKYRNGQWTALGTGLRGSTQSFTAQPIQYEGAPSLFVAGYFTSAGGLQSRYTAVWTGAEWLNRGRAQLGSGIASTTWDDGSGVSSYAATTPTTGSGSVSVWDGTGWSAVPGGVDSSISRMAGVSGGGSPGVYVAGPFGRALDGSGQPTIFADGIARWDGAAWSGLGGFYDASGFPRRAEALCAADLGDGPALYVGGGFDAVGGGLSANVGSLGGGGWSALGLGTSSLVTSLARFDDGTGLATYAVGTFNQAGGQFALWAARWNGATWAPAFNGLNDMPRTLIVHDDGSGPALYAGGSFDMGVGSPAVAKWNGSGWQAVGSGSFGGGVIYCLLSKAGPGGPVLYAGGATANANGDSCAVVAWNGSAWSVIGGTGMGGLVRSLAFHDDGSGETLYAVGSMTGTGHSSVGGVARLVAGSWEAVGGLSSAQGNGWKAVASYDDGSGAKLYVGGDSNPIPLLNTRNCLIRWDGTNWTTPGGGIPHSFAVTPEVNALAVHDDGSGSRLIAAGRFPVAGTARTLGVAAFDGVSWSSRPGVAGTVATLYSGSEAGAPKLWFGGSFFIGGLTVAPGVARYKDGAWQPLGTGTDGPVMALALHDAGGGVQLYAGGEFQSAGGSAASNVARWNGSAWSAVGAGCSDVVRALASYDGDLYAGGWFQSAGGTAAPRIARWNGSAWAGVGGGVTGPGGHANPVGVYALSVVDDGAGPALFAGGEFTTAGGVAAPRAARWDGTSWSALDVGLNDTALFSSVLPAGSGPAVAFSGLFSLAGGSSSLQTAVWQPCAMRASPPCPSDFNGDGFLDFFDYDDFVGCFETGACPPGKTADFNGDDFADFFDYDDFVSAFEAGC